MGQPKETRRAFLQNVARLGGATTALSLLAACGPDLSRLPGESQTNAVAQEKTSAQIDFELFVQNNPHLGIWRTNLRDPSVVLVDIYRNYQTGSVRIGVNDRIAPSANADIAGNVKPASSTIFSRTLLWIQTEKSDELWSLTEENPLSESVLPHFSVVKLFDEPDGVTIQFAKSIDMHFERLTWHRDGTFNKVAESEGLP